MKNLLQKMALAIGCLLIMSCNKDQILVNKIEGTYKIEKVIYIINTRDSVVNMQNSSMNFDQCNLKKQSGSQVCSGFYQIEGQDRINFNYKPENFGGREEMVININDSRLKAAFGGSYQVESRTDESLTLVRNQNFESGNKINDLRIFLKR